MDCIIPGHSIRPFCAAIGCLSRIGKELYIDFDPIEGCSIRSLNDSKSVFASFHFEPTFFSRCSSAPTSMKRSHKNSSRRKRKINDASTNNDDERWTVRIAMKALAAVIRQRKEVLNLHITTVGDHLAFEFQIQKIGGSIVRVTHKVGYSSAAGVAAVTSTDNASELIIQPNILSTMLEPLKRSVEIAILVNETHRLVSSVSFAHDDLPDEAISSLNRSQLNASLKTETSVSYDDLADVNYVGHADENDNENIPPPEDLKEQVVLVFTLKELKAFLQYCSQAVVDQELQVSIQFFWGGKPIVAKTEGEQFSAELVMATLDHKLLGNVKTSATATPAT
jgi:hypothetical protein